MPFQQPRPGGTTQFTVNPGSSQTPASQEPLLNLDASPKLERHQRDHAAEGHRPHVSLGSALTAISDGGAVDERRDRITATAPANGLVAQSRASLRAQRDASRCAPTPTPWPATSTGTATGANTSMTGPHRRRRHHDDDELARCSVATLHDHGARAARGWVHAHRTPGRHGDRRSPSIFALSGDHDRRRCTRPERPSPASMPRVRRGSR